MITDIVLWLDLAAVNQMTEATVRASTPREAQLLRLTKHVEPYGEGTPPAWPPVITAIDRLVREAQRLGRQLPDCRYWVTGRAGLPAFFHLGHRLSQMLATTFLHQPDDDSPLVPLPIEPRASADAPPYLQVESGTLPDRDPRGPAVLAVSCRHRPVEAAIIKALHDRRSRASGITYAHSPHDFDEAAARSAPGQLHRLLRDTCDAHPDRSALAIVLRGPTPLAFLVGRAINPRVCRDVQIFGYDGGRYSLAYELPYPPVPDRNKVVFVAASPADLPRLEIEGETDEIEREQSHLVTRALDFVKHPRAQPYDIYKALEEHQPGVLHVSGHGSSGELMFLDGHGVSRPLSTSDLVETIRLVGGSLRLAVLSACHSESHASTLLEHVDCVVAMRGPIRDDDARRFAVTLYYRLGLGDSVRDAFNHARHAMRLQRSDCAGIPPARDVEAMASGDHANVEPPQLCESAPDIAREVFLVRRSTP